MRHLALSGPNCLSSLITDDCRIPFASTVRWTPAGPGTGTVYHGTSSSRCLTLLLAQGPSTTHRVRRGIAPETRLPMSRSLHVSVSPSTLAPSIFSLPLFFRLRAHCLSSGYQLIRFLYPLADVFLLSFLTFSPSQPSLSIGKRNR